MIKYILSLFRPQSADCDGQARAAPFFCFRNPPSAQDEAAGNLSRSRSSATHTKISEFMETMSSKPKPSSVCSFFSSCFTCGTAETVVESSRGYVPDAFLYFGAEKEVASDTSFDKKLSRDPLYTLTADEIHELTLKLQEGELLRFLSDVEVQLAIMRDRSGTFAENTFSDDDSDILEII